MISDNNKRFILNIPIEQYDLIKRIAFLDGTSVAETVRKAVYNYTRNRKVNLSEDERIKEFWGKSSRAENGCLEWQGPSNNGGYGITSAIRGEVGVHRIAYTLTFGEIPSKLFVCHKCDNPKCVDPYHLFLGTLEDNFIDMRNKGRQKGEGRKLDGKSAAQIIRLYFGGTGLRMHHLGKKFNVGIGTISNVINRKTWIDAPEVVEEWTKVDEKRKRMYT